MRREELRTWLEARVPAPPDALAQRLRRIVDEAPESDLVGGTLPEVLSRMGRRVLEAVSCGPETGNEVALDLLAADALVTYAVEAAAESGDGVDGLVDVVLEGGMA